MPGNGTGSVDFGAAPAGNSSASLVITGQAAILSGSLLEAWLYPPGGTTDHSEDEHIAENIKINAGTIVAGTGFTIYAEVAGPGNRIHGLWKVAWAWI